ncbi:MAG: family 20 glycosylhydrolase [Armatimonadota bacterium]
MAEFFETLLPLPRVIEEGAGHTVFTGRATLAPSGLDSEQAGLMTRLAEIVLAGWLVPCGLTVEARLEPEHTTDELGPVPRVLRAEAYEIIVGETVILRAATLAGLQRGLQTVKQLLENAGDRGRLPRCRIVDWPRSQFRGIHYDFAREMEYRHEHIKSVIERLAYFKMNTMHLYLEGLFAFASAPEVTPPGAMTPEQAQDLCDYAKLFGMTLIPQIATMGHMNMLLHGPYEELREDPASSFNLCPTHPKSRPFLAGLIRDIAEAFNPPYIHLGYDESHSGHCPRCQQHGTPEELLSSHLNWMDAEVKQYGARSMIYADKFLSPYDFPFADAVNGGRPEQARQALSEISKDIIITDWHYTAPQCGTVKFLVEQGFEVHLASATNIYWHDSIPFHRGHHWIAETIDNAIAAGAKGGFNCNWELYRGAYFDNYWFFEALAAERYWTDAPHDFTTFSLRFSRRFWGVDKDYYGEMAGLMETAPTNRRGVFLDAGVFTEGGTSQARLDYLGIADYLDRQLAAFRKAAKRNGETLNMLDMPILIIRYLGARMSGTQIIRYALDLGDTTRVDAVIDGIRKVALRIAEKLEEGYRVYGGACVDRQRIAKHLQELDAFAQAGDMRQWFTFRNYSASALLPKTAPVAEVGLPAPDVKFSGIMNVHLVEMADVRGIHNGQDGLVYLKTAVEFTEGFTGRLLYGADGPVKAWVNGEAVDCRPDASNPCSPDEYAAEVTWRAGRNEVVFALDTNNGKAWGLVARTAGAATEVNA